MFGHLGSLIVGDKKRFRTKFGLESCNFERKRAQGEEDEQFGVIRRQIGIRMVVYIEQRGMCAYS